MIGIYKITSPTGKVYIGQSKMIDKRKHYYSKLKCKSQTKLFNSILKYGWDKHIFEVIEECYLELLNEREIYYINKENCISPNGLNLRHGGNIGLMSIETRAKMSEQRMGDKNIMFGKTHSKEARDKISKTHKGRKLTVDRIEQIRLQNTGVKKSQSCKDKVRASKLGKPRPQHVKDRLRETKSKPFAISNNSFYMEFESVTKAGEFLKCSRKELSNKTKYKEFNLMYL